MRKSLVLIGLILFCVSTSKAQVSPFQGLGQVQFFDNSGNLLTSGVLYSFQAGTSTQQATYTDSTGLIQNVNPITFGSGARAGIWLTTANFYKFVLCVQNDGAFCAPGDILFSVDNVPGGASSSGGGGSSPFTGIFISSTASPATSGVLRLASGDSVCFRNQAGSTNLCFKKDSNDLLSWDGGSFKLPEVGAPSGLAGFDILWADSTAHRLKAVNNGGTAAQYVLSGNDIGLTDNVNALHFGSTQETLSSTAPTTGQNLQFNGTSIAGVTPPFPIVTFSTINSGTSNFNATMVTAPANAATWRLSGYLHVITLGSSCTGNTNVALTLGYTDPAGGGAINETMPLESNASVAGNMTLVNNSTLGASQHIVPTSFRSASGANISYNVNITPGTGCSPAPKVEIDPILEQLTAN